MPQSQNVKIAVFVPLAHADSVREAIGNVGAGRIGNYTWCSFSSVGIGRFKAGDGAHPAIGEVGKLESVQEERIEFVCDRKLISDVVAATKSVHPYEEVALDIFPLEEFSSSSESLADDSDDSR